MGWRVSRKITKTNKQRYRIWSTISDDWLTKWSSREEIIKFIEQDALFSYKLRVVEMYYKFPADWGDYDNEHISIIRDEKRSDEYLKVMRRLLDAKNYNQAVEKEFEKIKKLLNL